MDEEQNNQQQDYHLGQVHVKDDQGQPICRQVGQFLTLLDIKAFKKVPAGHQCQRCRRSLGIDRYSGDIRFELSENQKQLIMAISQRIKESGDQWFPVAALCEKKTSSGWSSLHRSIRRLQARGLIEKQTNRQNRAEVRLTNKVYITSKGKITAPSKTAQYLTR